MAAIPMGRKIAQGIYLENSNSNSNNNSNNNSVFTRGSNNSNSNNSIFSRGSNNNSNSEPENWTEPMRLKPANVGNAASAVTFSGTRRFRRIEPLGKSRRNFWRHKTKTRRVVGNVNVNTKKSNTNYAAARLVAAAHEKAYSFNEMRNFVEKSRTTPNVKAAALKRIEKKYKNLGATW